MPPYKNNYGTIKLPDINYHWHYQRKEGEQPHLERRISLEPKIVKGEDRPKGSTIKVPPKAKGQGESSTRRDPSLYEHEALKLSLSTATPFVIEEDEDISSSIFCQFPKTALVSKLKWDISEGSPELSTAAVGISRGPDGIRDLYEGGTARKRSYMRSIKLDKLGSASIEELDIEIFIDIDMQEDTQIYFGVT
ncbi:hypothetical protein GcM3_218001b [Golovinomyces cichoracearum]|uniref:Uncharacterized protein n=1 Tax=Golovinomyces cichoracearum TaxID=62708 RepID=A0A420H7L3_9PEZI|nr:hypothetical protein GcM3_218001b [Golovinomyces cichoracearum]